MRQILPYKKLRAELFRAGGEKMRGARQWSILFPVARFPYLRITSFSYLSNDIHEQMLPPSHIAFLDPYSGSFIETRRITPAEGGFDWDWATPLPGPFLSLAEQRGEGNARYLEVLAEICPLLWKAFEEDSRSEATRDLVEQYMRIFPDVIQIPLLPYYMHLGREFWAWMHTVAGPGPAVK